MCRETSSAALGPQGGGGCLNRVGRGEQVHNSGGTPGPSSKLPFESRYDVILCRSQMHRHVECDQREHIYPVSLKDPKLGNQARRGRSFQVLMSRPTQGFFNHLEDSTEV